MFVATRQNKSIVSTKICLLRQNFCCILFCRDKHTFVATKGVFYRDKQVFVTTKLMSRQKILVAAPVNDTFDGSVMTQSVTQSCVKVEMAILGSPSPTVLNKVMVSVGGRKVTLNLNSVSVGDQRRFLAKNEELEDKGRKQYRKVYLRWSCNI